MLWDRSPSQSILISRPGNPIDFLVFRNEKNLQEKGGVSKRKGGGIFFILKDPPLIFFSSSSFGFPFSFESAAVEIDGKIKINK